MTNSQIRFIKHIVYKLRVAKKNDGVLAIWHSPKDTTSDFNSTGQWGWVVDEYIEMLQYIITNRKYAYNWSPTCIENISKILNHILRKETVYVIDDQNFGFTAKQYYIGHHYELSNK